MENNNNNNDNDNDNNTLQLRGLKIQNQVLRRQLEAERESLNNLQKKLNVSSPSGAPSTTSNSEEPFSINGISFRQFTISHHITIFIITIIIIPSLSSLFSFSLLLMQT